MRAAFGLALLLVMLASGAQAGMDDMDTRRRHLTCRLHKCGKGRHCKMHRGRPKCYRRRSRHPLSPCATMLCAPGHKCHVDGGVAQCLSACAAVRCAGGSHCQLDRHAKPVCVPDDQPNPCAFTTCAVGTFCQPDANDASAAVCITNCATVRCFPGTECQVDPQTGAPQCVAETKTSKSAATIAPAGAAFEAALAAEGITRKAACYSSCCKKQCACRKKRCGRWSVCEFRGGRAQCKSLCSMFRCPNGLKCRIGPAGPQCVSRCSGCCRSRCN